MTHTHTNIRRIKNSDETRSANLTKYAGGSWLAKSQRHPTQKRFTAMRATMHALYPQARDTVQLKENRIGSPP